MTALLLPRRSAHLLADEWEKIRCWRQDTPDKDTAIIREWENAVAAHVAVPAAAAVNSGRSGMTQILKHIGITSGDEVIVPAYTLKDLIPLIQHLGATVVPADADPATFNVTSETVAARISERTKAVIVLHAFGSPAPMPDIVAITKPLGIPVIEDCAHALGATLCGDQVGSYGYAAFFSFEMTKPINTYGGGMVVSHDTTLINTIRAEEEKKAFDLSGMMQKIKATQREMLLMRTGLALPLLLMMTGGKTKALISAAYRQSQHVPAASVRYSPVQARLGLEKLAGLDARIQHRQELALTYADALPAGVQLQRILTEASPTWYFCTAVLPTLAAPIRTKLLLHGIDAAIKDEIADDCGALLERSDCPVAHHIFEHTIALPMSDVYRIQDVQRVTNVLRRYFPA
jgi:perosamine synthetase